jgi:hypothetical protein
MIVEINQTNLDAIIQTRAQISQEADANNIALILLTVDIFVAVSQATS